ncbi:MAG: nucleotidyltransferase domain-containing protein, partial [Candidatus Bathyarchaeota archaeon]
MEKEDKEHAVEDICRKVLRKVTPDAKERRETLQFSIELGDNLADRLRSEGITADVQIQGSIAKDTWLSGDKDIDVFIALPRAMGKKIFPKVLDVVKSFAGERWIEAYAEHPYVEAEIENYKIDFVPCFNIEKAEEAGSSVDRTPLHTTYIKGHLSQQAKDEVRLLKQFMRGIGTYGAEIKVKGLSGYLCELLILHY